MTRVKSFATTEPCRSFFCLLQAMLLVAFSIPPVASASSLPSQGAAHASGSGKTGQMLASAEMRLAQLQTKLSLAAKNVISRLNPPSEFSRLRSQFEEPIIATGPTSPKEDDALFKTLVSFRDRKVEDDLAAFNVFLSDYPRSAWRVAVLTNVGLLDYHYGYFSRAITAWTEAWHAGRVVNEPQGRALVDRDVAELARMHARLGHADALEALFKEIGDRKVTGSATEILTGAHDGLWMMRHNPGVSYLCGPMALKNLLVAQGASPKDVQVIDDYRSGPHGVTLEQVQLLAARAGLHSRLIYRSPGEAVPMPSIVHWKVNHFAALLGFANGRYHVQDPTFGTDLWISPGALNAESSGFFLVPETVKAVAWKPVSTNSAQAIFGMGYTNQQKPGTSNCSEEGPACSNTNCNNGLCGYAINSLTVSLNLTDTPVGYTPPVGPSVKVSMSYNQREDSQPATFAWFNVGPKWTLNFLTYIQDDPRSPGSSVSRYVAGGGSYSYYGYSTTTKAFTPETSTGATLVQTSASPIVYTRTFPDGHQEIYSQSNGATSYPRTVFLSKMTDPAGNALTFNYDSQLRLTAITDATGRDTTFSYGASNPLLVTSIADPFGRNAQLSYDSLGRLGQIQDVLGLKSQFTYDASSIISALTTPYGTTHFAYSDSSSNPTGDVTRYLNATDPLGHTERMEYNVNEGSYADPANTVPTGMNTYNGYLYYRDTYYWDKHAYAVAAGDYSMAKVTHWCHWSQNSNYTSDFIESSKAPLENRVWFNYPGQGASYLSGTYNKPTAIGRVLDDGTSQVTKMTYNTQGNVTNMIDPVGRETQFIYAANGIDLLTVQQKTSASGYSTTAQFTYNAQHLPLSYTDASGQTMSFAFNSAGQPTEMTDALGEATQYQYDGLGYLTSVTNANGQTQASLTYNQYGDVATATDSEGYAVAYEYDHFDRVTQEIFPDSTTRKYNYTNLDLTSVTDRQGNTTTYAYDGVRNLLSVTDPLQHVTKLGYWENKTLKALTDPNGNTTNWSIDVENRVTGKRYADGTQVVNTYENTTSRLKFITDPLSQVKTFTYAWIPRTWDYNYDNAYRLTQAASSSGTYSYGLDPSDNITSVQSPSNTTGADYNNLNQIVNYGSYSYVYDKNGNVLDDGLHTYTWDAENRLLSVSSKSNTSQRTTFKYDGLDRRTAIYTSDGMTSEIRYLWCGEQLCQARTSSDVVQRRYYFEGESLPLSNTNLYYSQDQLGSVRDVLAIQTGSRVAEFDYEPFGNPMQTSGRTLTDFRYARMFYDQQDGLYLTQHRVYEPSSKRWLSRDPIGDILARQITLKLHPNTYAYADLNPISNIDPSGLYSLRSFVCDLPGGALGALVGQRLGGYLFGYLGVVAGVIGGEIVDPLGGGVVFGIGGYVGGRWIGSYVGGLVGGELGSQVSSYICDLLQKADNTSTASCPVSSVPSISQTPSPQNFNDFGDPNAPALTPLGSS